MGHPIEVFEFGSRHVLVGSDIRGKYHIRTIDLGRRNTYLMVSPAGNYFFDDPTWSNPAARIVRFSTYDAAVIFINMFDFDKLVDLSHSDASIRE